MDEFTFLRDFPFYFAIWKATEGFWSAAGGAAWDASLSSSKTLFSRVFKTDDESKRAAAFGKAVLIAQQNTQPQNISSATVEEILNALNRNDAKVNEALADEAAKIMLFSSVPNLPRLGKAIEERLHWDMQVYRDQRPPDTVTVTAVLAEFLSNLRNALRDQYAYRDLIQNEILQAMLQVVAALRPTSYDDESQYRSLLATDNRQLNFVGIADPKGNRAITLEDVFVQLQTERRQHEDRWGSDWRYHAARLSGDELDDHQWQRMMSEPRTVIKEKMSIDSALKRQRKLVILGDPGAGKTTLLKYLTVICAENRSDRELGLTTADNQSPLPIYITLRGFAAKQASRTNDYRLVDYFSTFAKEHLQLNLPPDFFEKALRSGRCLVCLDGLDEVWQVGARAAVRDAVANLARHYPENIYLITSRIIGYGEAALNEQEFEHHTVLPLELPAIKKFVTDWYSVREPDPVRRQHATDDLNRTIEREARIQTLAANPLLLTIITLVHRVEAQLPHERVLLYRKCVETLIDSWENVKSLTLEEKQRPFYNKRQRLLEQLAIELHRRAEKRSSQRRLAQANSRQQTLDEPQTIRIGDLERLITELLMANRGLDFADDRDGAREEAQAFIHLVRQRTGLLVERGDGIFTFAHLTFQEYLAAQDIEKRCYTPDALWQEIAPHLHDPHWREVILLLLGSLNRSDELPTILVNKIIEAGKSDPFEALTHRHLHLAARILADKISLERKLERQIIAELLKIANSSGEFGYYNAIRRLAPLDSKEQAVEGLLALAQNDQTDDWVRSEAAQALGSLGRQAEAASLLLALAQNDKVRSGVRSDAAQALGSLGRQEDAARLLLALAQSYTVHSEVRRDVAQALGLLGRQDDFILNGLLALAQNDKVEAGLRRDAAKALGLLGRQDDFVLKALLALAQNDKVHSGVRSAAAQAIGSLGRQDDFILKALLALAQNDKVHPGVRRDAAQALGSLGRQDDAARLLLALAQNYTVPAWARRDAAKALGSFGRQDDFILKGLLALAQNDKVDDGVRRDAAQALGSLGRQDDFVLNGLLALAQNDKVHPGVRRDAAQALGSLGRQDDFVLNGLLALAQNDRVDARVCSAAAQALGSLGRQDDAARLLLALAQNYKAGAWVRRDAAQVLGSLGRQKDAARLLLALAQNYTVDDGMRRDAAKALGSLGRQDDFILNGLLALAQNDKVHFGVRRDAAQALGSLGRQDDFVLKALLALAQNDNEDDWIRHDATRALASLGRQDGFVLHGLLALAQNDKVADRVRSEAYWALIALLGIDRE